MAGGTTTYSYSGTVNVGVWAKRSAGWQKVTTYPVTVNGGTGYTTGGNRSFSWALSNQTFQLGSGVLAVGVTVESVSGGPSATLDTFSQLAWQAPGTASSTRSATPNSEKTTVTISP